MSQLEQEKLQRVHLGALVDREQRDQLVRLSREADRSVSATVRLALAGYLNSERSSDGEPTEPGDAARPRTIRERKTSPTSGSPNGSTDR